MINKGACHGYEHKSAQTQQCTGLPSAARYFDQNQQTTRVRSLGAIAINPKKLATHLVICHHILQNFMKMKNFLPVLACVLSLAGNSLFAKEMPAILLQPINDDNTANVVSTKNIYGKCAGEVVAILGIISENFDGYTNFSVDVSGNPDIILRGENKETSFGKLLSDYNVVHCVKTKHGFRLVIASHCGGSVCSDSFDFNIIDTTSHKIIAPANGKSCDAQCASKFLDSRIPFKIDGY